QRASDRRRAAHRCPRSLEAGEETIARGVELATVEAREQLAHARVVLFEQLAPASVAQLARALGGADDVGEENRRQETVGPNGGPHAGQKLLDLGDHGLDIPGPKGVVVARQLDEPGAGNRPRELAAGRDWENVATPVQAERRCLNRRQARRAAAA